MNHKENRHYKETHRKIRNISMELLQKNPGERLSVRRICEAASIHRTTFYAHYESIGDLLQEMSTIHAVELKHLLEEANISTGNFYSPDGMQILLSHIREHPDFYRAYLPYHGRQHLMESAFSFLWNSTDREAFWSKNIDYDTAHLSFVQFFGGMDAVMEHWLLHDCEEDLDTVASVISAAVPAGLLNQK